MTDALFIGIPSIRLFVKAVDGVSKGSRELYLWLRTSVTIQQISVAPWVMFMLICSENS